MVIKHGDYTDVSNPTLSLPLSWPRSFIMTVPSRKEHPALSVFILHLSLKDDLQRISRAWLLFPVNGETRQCSHDARDKSDKLYCLASVYVCVCVTFLSHGAPDGDNEDTDDSENQQGQNATYHCIWNCAVSLHHCTRI